MYTETGVHTCSVYTHFLWGGKCNPLKSVGNYSRENFFFMLPSLFLICYLLEPYRVIAFLRISIHEATAHPEED